VFTLPPKLLGKVCSVPCLKILASFFRRHPLQRAGTIADPVRLLAEPLFYNDRIKVSGRVIVPRCCDRWGKVAAHFKTVGDIWNLRSADFIPFALFDRKVKYVQRKREFFDLLMRAVPLDWVWRLRNAVFVAPGAWVKSCSPSGVFLFGRVVGQVGRSEVSIQPYAISVAGNIAGPYGTVLQRHVDTIQLVRSFGVSSSPSGVVGGCLGPSLNECNLWPDDWRWGMQQDSCLPMAKFSVRAATSLATSAAAGLVRPQQVWQQRLPEVPVMEWRKVCPIIWKANLPRKLKQYLFFAALDAFPTGDNLRKGSCALRCPMCEAVPESLMHLLSECPCLSPLRGALRGLWALWNKVECADLVGTPSFTDFVAVRPPLVLIRQYACDMRWQWMLVAGLWISCVWRLRCAVRFQGVPVQCAQSWQQLLSEFAQVGSMLAHKKQHAVDVDVFAPVLCMHENVLVPAPTCYELMR
jgi:hypothetical protein